MKIRRAEASDLGQLLPLVRGYREFYKQAHDAERERNQFEAHLRDGTATIFIAVDDSQVVGFVAIMRYQSTVRLRPTMILEDLFVAPDARGSGAADALMEAAIGHARAAGASGMFLETAMDNHRAQAVYERNGWTREGTFFKYNSPL